MKPSTVKMVKKAIYKKMDKKPNYEWTKEVKDSTTFFVSKEIKERNEASEELFSHCAPRCPRCQGTLQTMNVHGHEQCVLCHSIVDDCCQGAQLK